jgi:hypothetical protein
LQFYQLGKIIFWLKRIIQAKWPEVRQARLSIKAFSGILGLARILKPLRDKINQHLR